MSLKELKEAKENKKLVLGIRQILKNSKDKKVKIYVARDARSETIDKLQEKEINFEFSKTKKEISNELDLDFESEVFLIR